MIAKLQTRWWLVVVWIVAMGFLTACEKQHQAAKAPAPVPPPPVGAAPDEPVSPLPTQHAFYLFTKLDNEPERYGMYTYVLFGRRMGKDASALSASVSRYQALLEAIESSTAPASTLESANIPREETNLFCIPAKSASPDAGLTLNNYNFDLGLVYRSIAQGGIAADSKFSRKLATGPGPFLVSSLQPLNQVRSQAPMLFSDLSATNPAAMREVVAAYKQRISQGALDKAEAFQPLRLALLNLILDANANVKFVREAVAAWLPEESGSSQAKKR